MRILLRGYGNPGRQDDGVGVALVDELEAWASSRHLSHLTVERDYQLNIEDSWEASRHDVVVFVDASRGQSEAFLLRRVWPAPRVAFSTHAMSPESVLALCQELYGARPSAHLLTVRGYSWEPNESMTSEARANMEAAKTHLMAMLEAPNGLR